MVQIDFINFFPVPSSTLLFGTARSVSIASRSDEFTWKRAMETLVQIPLESVVKEEKPKTQPLKESPFKRLHTSSSKKKTLKRPRAPAPFEKAQEWFDHMQTKKLHIPATLKEAPLEWESFAKSSAAEAVQCYLEFSKTNQ